MSSEFGDEVLHKRVLDCLLCSVRYDLDFLLIITEKLINLQLEFFNSRKILELAGHEGDRGTRGCRKALNGRHSHRVKPSQCVDKEPFEARGHFRDDVVVVHAQRFQVELVHQLGFIDYVVSITDVFEGEKHNQVGIKGVMAEPREVLQHEVFVFSNADFAGLLVEGCFTMFLEKLHSSADHLFERCLIPIGELVLEDLTHYETVLFKFLNRNFGRVALFVFEQEQDFADCCVHDHVLQNADAIVVEAQELSMVLLFGQVDDLFDFRDHRILLLGDNLVAKALQYALNIFFVWRRMDEGRHASFLEVVVQLLAL